MTRVDRYIVAEFARVFLICFITFLGLFIVADFVNHLDELAKHGETHGGLGRVLLGYYGPKIPWFFDLIGRIVALVAAVFAVTSLQRNNEMAAMMAAGVSRWRIVKPLVYSVAVVAVLGFLNRELVIPRLGASIMRDARNYDGHQSEEVLPQYDHATDVFVDGGGVLPAKKAIVDPRFDIPTSMAPRGTRVDGALATHRKANKQHPAGFLVTGVRESDLGVRQTLMHDDQPVVFHPRDYAWLKPDELFVATGLPFAQLRAGTNWRQYASTFNLISGARNPSLDSGADVSVRIHTRILKPVSDLIVLFLGLPIVLSRESRNAYIAVGSSMSIVALFVLVSLALHSMGMNYMISPSLAAWGPLLIFIPVSVLLSEPLRR